MVINEHPFVVWMDTSIRYTASDFSSIITRAKLEGVLAHRTSKMLLRDTTNSTFKMLKTNPWLYKDKAVFGGAFIVIQATPYVVQYILRPWISCALKLGCMMPAEESEKFRQCDNSDAMYFRCHRFDQSVLSILIHMVYREEEKEHEACDQTICGIKCAQCKGVDIPEQLLQRYTSDA